MLEYRRFVKIRVAITYSNYYINHDTKYEIDSLSFQFLNSTSKEVYYNDRRINRQTNLTRVYSLKIGQSLL